ncbi:MAG: oligosaccharide flippase family protein [Elusimicrobia bacterium]|nr:oligosaccharide flippase family protein [Elusimicrobiota bacterium]
MLTTVETKIKSILTYLLPSLLSFVVPIVSFPIMTRFLTPEDFGIVALALAFPGLVTSLITCNIQIGAQRYYFEYRRDSFKVSALINSTVSFLLCVFVISSVFIFIIKDFISNIVMGGSKYGLAVFFSYATACLNILVNFYLTMYRNMERPKEFSKFTIMGMLINLILSLVLVVIFRLGYMGIIYGTFAALLWNFCILFWQFQQEFPFCLDKKIFTDNLKYGFPLVATYFSGPVYQFLDKYMICAIISLSSTGIYSIAQNISKKLFIFISAIQSTFHPIFMKDMFDRGKEGAVSIGRNFTIFTYISLSAVLGMVLFGEEVIYILAPETYYNAINVMLILLCGISMQTFGKIVDIPLAYVKKAYLSVPITFAGTVINILLNLLLIPHWRAAGAGLATTITIFFTNSIYLMVSQRYYNIVYEKKILALFYLNVFLSAVVIIIFREIGGLLVIKYCLKVIFLVLFVVLGIKANIVTKRNIRAALNIFMLKTKCATA